MAVDFAATTQRIQLPDSLSLVRNVPGATVAAYVKLNSKSSNQTVFSLTTTGSRSSPRVDFFAVGAGGTYLRATGRALDGDTIDGFESTSLSLSVGVWSFIAATFDFQNRIIKLWLDGSSQTSSTLTNWTAGNCSNTTTLANTLGNKDPTPGNYPLLGVANGLRIYNRILSDNEIQTIRSCLGTDNILYGLQARYLFREKQDGYVCAGTEIVKDYMNNAPGIASANCTYRGDALRGQNVYL